MDILDELIDKFMTTLDSELQDDTKYKSANAVFHEFIVKELSEKKAAELESIMGILTGAVFDSASRAGMKLGAKIALGLLSD